MYEKYKDAEAFDVPSDQYEDIQKRYSERISKLEKQEQRLVQMEGDLADQKRSEIERCKDLKKRFRDSGVSTEEAMEAAMISS